MNTLVQDLLDYYKKINGIDPLDVSQDEMLKLLIEVAIEVAKQKACDWSQWDSFDKLPKPIILGIMELIGLSVSRGDINRAGVKSESIGGMSQTFFDADYLGSDSYFKPAFDLFGMYCSVQPDSLVFRKARRGNCGN